MLACQVLLFNHDERVCLSIIGSDLKVDPQIEGRGNEVPHEKVRTDMGKKADTRFREIAMIQEVGITYPSPHLFSHVCIGGDSWLVTFNAGALGASHISFSYPAI